MDRTLQRISPLLCGGVGGVAPDVDHLAAVLTGHASLWAIFHSHLVISLVVWGSIALLCGLIALLLKVSRPMNREPGQGRVLASHHQDDAPLGERHTRRTRGAS